MCLFKFFLNISKLEACLRWLGSWFQRKGAVKLKLCPPKVDFLTFGTTRRFLLSALVPLLVHCFGRLLCQFDKCPALPTPHWKWFMVGIGPGKFLHWSSFSVKVQVGGNLQGWFPLTELPWDLLPVPSIFAGPPLTFNGIGSQANQ